MNRAYSTLMIIVTSALLSMPACAISNAQHEQDKTRSLSIKGTSLSIDGTELWLGDTMDNWLASISGKPRCFHKKNSLKLCVWDEIGIEVGTAINDITRIEFINVHVAKDSSLESIEKRPSFPTGLFTGHLEIDGMPFDATTEFRSIGLRADRKRQLSCGSRSCSHPYGYFNEAAKLHFQLDRGSDRGKIIQFSINCFSIRECQALIPKQQAK